MNKKKRPSISQKSLRLDPGGGRDSAFCIAEPCSTQSCEAGWKSARAWWKVGQPARRHGEGGGATKKALWSRLLSHAVSLLKMSNEILSFFFLFCSEQLYQGSWASSRSLSLSPPHSQPGMSHRGVCSIPSMLGVNEGRPRKSQAGPPGRLQANTITFMAA